MLHLHAEYKLAIFAVLPAGPARGSLKRAMSKIFVNENPQAPAPSPVEIGRPNGAATQDLSRGFAVLCMLGTAGGACLLLYSYWKFAVAALLGMLLYVCWSTGRILFLLCLLVVVVASLNSTRAQAAVDSDTIKFNGVLHRIWVVDTAETRQARADG